MRRLLAIAPLLNACAATLVDLPLETSSSSGAPTTTSSGDTSSTSESTGGCEPGTAVCLDEESVQTCLEDGALAVSDCAYVCETPELALGCHTGDDGGACRCALDPAKCPSPDVNQCLGDNQLLMCIGGVPMVWDCDAACVMAGYGGANACIQGDPTFVCFCDDVCMIDGAVRCDPDDPDAILVCAAGAWTPESCATRCADAGHAGSLGCAVFIHEDSDCRCI